MNEFSFQQLPAKKESTSKHLLGALFLLLIVSLFLFFSGKNLIHRFSDHVHPLLQENQSFYAYFDRSRLNTDDFSIIRELLVETVTQTDDPALEDLSQLMQEIAVNTGFFIINKEYYFFIEDLGCQNQAEVNLFLEDKAYLSTNTAKEQNCYTVFSQKKWEPVLASSSKRILQTKLALVKNADNEPISAIFVQKIGGIRLIGFVISTSTRLELRLGQMKSDFFQALETKQGKASLFSFFHQNITEPSSFDALTMIEPFSSFSLYPGEFTVYQGNSTDFSKNKYLPEASWEWKGEYSQAEKVKEALVNELSELYPIAIEQVLPDETIILELQQDKDAFITTSLDQEGREVALYTYPDGQIQEVYLGEFVSLQKEMPLDVSLTENNCIYPGAIGYGHVDGAFISTKMWKSAEFSYDQQKMILCFEKNT